MLDDIVEAHSHIVGKARGIGTVDDTGLKRSEDLGKVHHDGRSAKLPRRFQFPYPAGERNFQPLRSSNPAMGREDD